MIRKIILKWDNRSRTNRNPSVLIGGQPVTALLSQHLLRLQALLEVGKQVLVVLGIRQTLAGLLGNFDLKKCGLD